jgi:hypothetical protein
MVPKGMSKASRLHAPQLFRGVTAGEAETAQATAAPAHEPAHAPAVAAADFVCGDDAREGEAAPLVARLCAELGREGVRYCHWKSNWRLALWLQGEGDLDLLVERADAGRFESVICRLGFKPARPTEDRRVPGVQDFYGFDAEAQRLVHLHVHYRLVLGHDLTKNFHLPIEKPYLEAADTRGVIPVPSPEFELLVYVLRMVLKYAPAGAALRRLAGRKGSSAVRKELDFLEARASRAGVRTLLAEHLPFVDAAFFDACAESLRGGSLWSRAAVRWELERRLKAHARRGQMSDALTKLWRRASRTVRERVLGRSGRKRLGRSGAIIALVGGDGAGKTTNARALHKWLSKKFVARRFHLGKPPRSPFTLAVIIALRVRRLFVGGGGAASRRAGADERGASDFPGYLQLLRWVCAARDRHRLYVRTRRFAAAGGLAICDRFPVAQLRLMDGPNIGRTVAPARANSLVRWLQRAEERDRKSVV